MPLAPDAPHEPLNGTLTNTGTIVGVLFLIVLFGTAAATNPEAATTVAMLAFLAVWIPLQWVWTHILIVAAVVVLLYLALLIDRLRVGHNDQERRLLQLERTARSTLNR